MKRILSRTGLLLIVSSFLIFSGHQTAFAVAGEGTATINGSGNATVERTVSNVFTVVLTVGASGITVDADNPTFAIPAGFTAPHANGGASVPTNAGEVDVDGEWFAEGGATCPITMASSSATGQVIMIDVTTVCTVGPGGTITLTYKGKSNSVMGATNLTISTADDIGNSPVIPLTGGSPTITVTPTDISTAGVSSFVAPVTGATPGVFGDLSSDATTTYTVTGLTWSPVHDPYQGAVVYTATVELTSAAGYKFPVAGIASTSLTVDSGTVVSDGVTGGPDASGNTITFSVVFPITISSPTISTISPSSGSTAGGTSVIITGTDFANGAMVTVGGNPATGIIISSTTEMSFITPAGAPGAADIVITNPDMGEATSTGGFNYEPTVSNISPASGTTAGGTLITITGTGFVDGFMTVQIGLNLATDVIVASSTEMTAITPVGMIVGAAEVTVTNFSDGGIATSTFTYNTSSPTISTISPSSGSTAGGTSVIITGTDFANGAMVTVGGNPATGIIISSTTEMSFITPAGAPGAADIVITNPDMGEATSTGGFNYEPTVSNISPASGTTAGGTLITITGTGFVDGFMTVQIGLNLATDVIVASSTEMTAITPVGMIVGAAEVTVTNFSDGGIATSTFTYNTSSPTISTISPSSGSTAGGTSVIITGTDFANGAMVTVGGNPATGIIISSTTEMSFITPAGAPGAADIVITNPDMGEATSTNAFTYIDVAFYVDIFSDVTNALALGGITTNLNDCGSGFINSPTSCYYLYFEKTGLGRISFEGPLDLTDSQTVNTLGGMGTGGIYFDNGEVKFDATTSDAFMTYGGSIEMYGLNFPATPAILVNGSPATGDDVNLVTYDSETGTLTFHAKHFSTFTVEEAPYILSAKITGGNEITIVYSEPVTGLTGDYTDLILNGSDPRNVNGLSGDGTDTVVLTFDGSAVGTGATATIDINVPPLSVKSVSTETDLPETNNFPVTDGQNPTVTALQLLEGETMVDYQLPFTPSGPRPTLHGATLTFSEALSADGKSAIEDALSLGADRDLGFAWGTGGNTGKLRISYEGASTSTTATFTNDVYATFTDVAGNSTTTLLINSVLSEDQVEPSDGEATLSTTTPEVVISDPTATTTITIGSDVEDPTIDVSAFIGSNGTGTLPAIIINSDTADVEIPDGAEVVSASTTWNGVIAAPKVTTVTLPNPSGETRTFSTGIELGFSGIQLTFSKAVKIVVPGQSGMRVGYTRDGGTTFTEITTDCGANTQIWADTNLAAGGDCKIASSTDLVIWTKHFTTFATYTQSTNPVSSGGGGGGWIPPTAQPRVVTPALSSATGYRFASDLEVGSKGAEVTELQKVLVAEGHLVMPAGVAYGYFGNATKLALIKYQKAKGITPTSGMVGPKTRGVLNASAVSAPATQNIASMTLKQLVQMLLDIGAIVPEKIDAAKKLIATL